MIKKSIVFGIIFLLAATASADEYLKSTCQSILKNDIINDMQVLDIKKDGTPHILFGTAIGGVLYNYVYKGAECTVDWTAMGNGGWNFNTGGDVRSFIMTDLTGDGKNEFVMNSVKSTYPGGGQPKDYLRAISINAIDYWGFRDSCGFSQAVDAADIDGTGKPNGVFGTLSNNICALKDSGDGHLDKDQVLWTYSAKYPVGYVKTADIDADGKVEVVAVASKYMDAYVDVLSSDGKLKWEKKIDSGLYQAVQPNNVILVQDINGDGKQEIVIGTYKNGVRAFDNAGNTLWTFDTKYLVSAVLIADIAGSKVILTGSAPNVYALDGRGTSIWTWKAPTSSTIYSMSASDIDGKTAIAVGSTKFLYVLDNEGKLKGSWKYTVEIQGLNKAAEERNANAVAVYMGDLDGDGQPEIAAGWNWEQSTVRGNQYSADLRVYKINKNYVPDTETATTMAQTGGQQTGEPTETTIQGGEEGGTDNAQTGEEEATTTTQAAKAKSKIPCIPAATALLALGITIVAKIPLAITKD
jgi:hypothetical protein